MTERKGDKVREARRGKMVPVKSKGGAAAGLKFSSSDSVDSKARLVRDVAKRAEKGSQDACRYAAESERVVSGG